jgi:scyllo-inositol 2-dehydrogenase (NADP+)
MGVEVEEREDGLHVPGRQKPHGADDWSRTDDHRIAMAFSIAALGAEGESQINGAEAVAVSFPAVLRDAGQGAGEIERPAHSEASSMIGVGIIGYGFAGRTFHARVIRAVDGLNLIAVVQRHGNEAAEEMPGVRVVRSVEELLALDEVRLVAVATPNATHAALAKQCLEAGRDVVIDKPIAASYFEADDIAATARRHGRLVTVYQNRRWDGDFLTVKKLIASGELGRVLNYESHFDRWRPTPREGTWKERPEPGSGILFDLGSHLVDQALDLFGVPEAVGADLRVEREGSAIDDAVDVTLYYPKMRALLRASMTTCAPGPRFTVHGTKGSFVKYGLDPQEDALKANARPGSEHWGEEPESSWGVLTPAEGASRKVRTKAGDYRGLYENVRDAIMGTAALVVTPERALEVMRVIEMAQESYKEKCLVKWR